MASNTSSLWATTIAVVAASTAVSIIHMSMCISLQSVDFCNALDAAGMMIRAATFFDKAELTLSVVSATWTDSAVSFEVLLRELQRIAELVNKSDKYGGRNCGIVSMTANRHRKVDNCVTFAFAILLLTSNDSFDTDTVAMFVTFNREVNAFMRFGRIDRDWTPTARTNVPQHKAVVDTRSPVIAAICCISVVLLLQSSKIREQWRSESSRWCTLRSLDPFVDSGMYRCRVIWSIEYMADCIKTRSAWSVAFAKTSAWTTSLMLGRISMYSNASDEVGSTASTRSVRSRNAWERMSAVPPSWISAVTDAKNMCDGNLHCKNSRLSVTRFAIPSRNRMLSSSP